MRIYAVKTFMRFARKERITAESLIEAVRRIESGLIDAELGGSLVKQRVARTGEGRSGGYRTIVAVRKGDRHVFLFGFAKNERDHIETSDLAALKALGKVYLSISDAELGSALGAAILEEIDAHA